MGFTRAIIEIKPALVGTGIKCQLRKTRKAPACLTLFIRASIAADLYFSDGDRIDVLIGDGEHHGVIRLRRNNSVKDGATAQRRETGKGAFFVVKLGHQPLFVNRSEPSAWCQWEAQGEGWVEIVLPKWADETAPVKRAAALPPAPSVPGTKQNVTAAVMGDPPPGRREMLRKMGEIKV